MGVNIPAGWAKWSPPHGEEPEECSICTDPLESTGCIAHSPIQGPVSPFIHPVHQGCVEDWWEKAQNGWMNPCPICRREGLDFSSPGLAKGVVRLVLKIASDPEIKIRVEFGACVGILFSSLFLVIGAIFSLFSCSMAPFLGIFVALNPLKFILLAPLGGALSGIIHKVQAVSLSFIRNQQIRHNLDAFLRVSILVASWALVIWTPVTSSFSGFLHGFFYTHIFPAGNT